MAPPKLLSPLISLLTKLSLLPLIPLALPIARRWAQTPFVEPKTAPRKSRKNADVLSFCEEQQFTHVIQSWPRDYLGGISLHLFDRIPAPPLGDWPVVSRFRQLRDFKELESAAMALPGRVLMRHDCVAEATVHHELVHTVQWNVLGPERFLVLYAVGLIDHGYEDSPLEAMAYSLEEEMLQKKRKRRQRKDHDGEADSGARVEELTAALLTRFREESWIHRAALWIATRV